MLNLLDGFLSAELRELRGKDYQQIFLFADDFTIGTLPKPKAMPWIPLLLLGD